MKPGDVITCAGCGAQARAAWSSQERPWCEGWPLVLSWTHGPHERHHVTREAPALCSWCFELRQALGADAAPLHRPAPGAAPGDWNDVQGAGEGPLNAGQEDVREAVRPRPGPVGNKAPLERPATVSRPAPTARGQLGLF